MMISHPADSTAEDFAQRRHWRALTPCYRATGIAWPHTTDASLFDCQARYTQCRKESALSQCGWIPMLSIGGRSHQMQSDVLPVNLVASAVAALRPVALDYVQG